MSRDLTNPGLLPQKSWNTFETLADAIAGLTYKEPGTEVYIVSEDEYYYWKDDLNGFLKQELIMGNGGGGGGTVTNVSILSANGFAGIVTDPTGSAVISLYTTVTGILKGDGTSVSAALAGDFPVLNQDTTGSAASFTGSLIGDVTGTQTATTIANTVVTGKTLTGYVSGAGTVTATDTILQAIQKLDGNINALVTGVSSVNGNTGAVALTGTLNRITINAANVFDIASTYVGQSSITTVGTLTSGSTGAGFTLALGTSTITGALTETHGGTNQTSYNRGDILYASAADTLSKLSIGSNGTFLRSNGIDVSWSTTSLPNSAVVGDLIYASSANTYNNLTAVATGNVLLSGGIATAPLWGKVGLTTHVSGTLGVTNGGTGTATQFTSGSIVFAGVSGVYSQDNAHLFWDDSNNRLGINTNAPLKTLHSIGDVRIEPIVGVTFEIESGTITTTGNTTATCQTIAIPNNKIVMLEARVHAVKTSGAGPGAVGDGNVYIRTVRAKNKGGVVTIGSIQSSYTDEDIGAANATFVVSGTNVVVQVAGSNNNNYTWTSTCIITK